MKSKKGGAGMAGSKSCDRELGYDRRDEAIGYRYRNPFRTMYVRGDSTDLCDIIAGIDGINFLNLEGHYYRKVLFWWDESW